MKQLQQTVFLDRHESLGATLIDFSGWRMPLHYPTGIVQEHLATRRNAGLFDVSHMGRFRVSGADALPFLQRVLTNNAAALELLEGQYTLIPDSDGGAIDDAYLYRFVDQEFLLVVNAANRQKDWEHFLNQAESFPNLQLEDHTRSTAMLSLQGPESKAMLIGCLESGALPEPMRNALSLATIKGIPVRIARTGYTGEPVCFELFLPADRAEVVWDMLVAGGATPVGLGARDTLRLEAGLPLYGNELGADPDGVRIPVFACQLAKFAVSFSPLKGEFIGRTPLGGQYAAYRRILNRDFSLQADLPRLILPVALIERGVARSGDPVFKGNRKVGVVTSGTMVPFWKIEGTGIASTYTDEKGMRAICLAYIDSDLRQGDGLDIEIRGRRTAAVVVPYHLRSEAPPFARPVSHAELRLEHTPLCAQGAGLEKVTLLVKGALANHRWRQEQCINLIPSEMTASALVRALSISDPAGRYAEHKQVKALREADVFYYQGTEFIAEVEKMVVCELQRFLECTQVETRPVSGQMANTTVFSALVDYRNRADRKREQLRIAKVMNHHIIKGGHLSAQPLGALRDFVRRDAKWEKPAVVNFPVRPDNPYRIDLEATKPLIEEHRPELIIFGKSVILHKEPVAEISSFVKAAGIETLILYDAAHVLGLLGPHFQKPFEEGADLVTGSTHKTFFGSQRGIVAADWAEDAPIFELWEAIQRRAFPGAVSNHHLGTLLGLLAAAYEMNAFKDPYQQQVLSNAKAFARALKDCGLDVAGDPDASFTETHQVVIHVGYGAGPEAAHRLEQNHIIVNYQAAPDEEGFTAAGALRMGVAEMTRFGMTEADFQQLAQLIHDGLAGKWSVKDAVLSMRRRFTDMHYCFSGDPYDKMLREVLNAVG